MAKFSSTGLGDLARQIEKLKLTAGEIEKILMAGGEPIEERIKSNIRALPVRPPNQHGSPEKKVTGVLRVQKNGLLKDVGIAKMQYRNGFYDVKIGYYNGYLKPKTKRWPEGPPTQMLARSLEKGTSWMNKQPVVKPALNKARDKVVPAMQKEFEKLTKE